MERCDPSDEYDVEYFLPKDLLALSSTCKELCLEIRRLIFIRSALVLTTFQLRTFHANRFRHQLFDFRPWYYVRKLVLHILLTYKGSGPQDQLRILGNLDLSKIEPVFLVPG
jgi:hypothetical protein